MSHLVKVAQDNMDVAKTRSEDVEMFVKHMFNIRGLSGDLPVGKFLLHKELVYWLGEVRYIRGISSSLYHAAVVVHVCACMCVCLSVSE